MGYRLEYGEELIGGFRELDEVLVAAQRAK